jgi:hypothetical protein
MIRLFLLFASFVSYSNYIFAQQDLDILNVPTVKPTTSKQNKPKVTDISKIKRADFKDKIQQTQEALFVPDLSNKIKDSLTTIINLYKDSLTNANEKTVEVYEKSKYDKNTLLEIIADMKKDIRENNLEVHKVKCDSSNLDNFLRLSFILTEKNRKKITSSNDVIKMRIKKQVGNEDFTSKNIIHISGKDYTQEPIILPKNDIKFDFISAKNDEFKSKDRFNFYVFLYSQFDKPIGSYIISNLKESCVNHQELKEFSTFSNMNVANYDTNDVTLRSKKVIFKAWDGDKIADGDKITVILNDEILVFSGTPLFSKDSPAISKLIELKNGLNNLTVIASSYGSRSQIITPFITIDDGYLHKQPIFQESGSWKEKTWTIFVKSFD